MKKIISLAVLAGALYAQNPPAQDPYEGLWQGYAGEWGHVSRHLVALAEAIPAERV